MQRVLIIGEEQKKQIAELKQIAKANPLDAIASKNVADKAIDAYRDMMQTMSIELPRGFYITYTNEIQPNAPTASKLCHHISISIDTPKMLPNPEAVELILESFGMKSLQQSDHVYIEDVDPINKAVNVVQLIQE